MAPRILDLGTILTEALFIHPALLKINCIEILKLYTYYGSTMNVMYGHVHRKESGNRCDFFLYHFPPSRRVMIVSCIKRSRNNEAAFEIDNFAHYKIRLKSPSNQTIDEEKEAKGCKKLFYTQN